MLATLIPLFDENMQVRAYSLFSQKKNMLEDPLYLGTAVHYDAVMIQGFDIVNSVGINTLAPDSEIFIPVTNISIFGDINSQCKVPHKRIALLMDNYITPESSYVDRIRDLKRDGYKLAIRKIGVADFENYREILKLVDYVFLDHQKIVISKAKIYFSSQFPNVSLIAGNLHEMEIFEALKQEGGYQYYEGAFYRMPYDKGDKTIAPLKINYLQLLNVVNDDNFDLTKAADIIGQDTALVISLLEMVNKMALNSEITSIRHAAAMLGQRELKKWITTAITRQLCSDKPSEITRISLLRAKFAESIAPLFGMKFFAQELFLMGLFSVIDIMLDTTMENALEMINISKNIKSALISHSGPYAKVLDFIDRYDNADWQEVSRVMIMESIKLDDLYAAYINSLEWYRDLF
ncbi:MAG: HDOD domain-containing protein [Lachnospiraceae bacterium]|nr:HDOD domain-containing protein [Lachnospiraceae bacterium]